MHRVPLARCWAVLPIVAIAGTACDGSGPTTAPPEQIGNRPPLVVAPNDDQPATAGVAFSYDATRQGTVFSDPDGDPLTYRIIFTPAPNGLTSDAGLISGTPTEPATVTAAIVAEDGNGGIARDSFDIVALSLTPFDTPTLPAVTYRYAAADVALPNHFTDPDSPFGDVAATDNTPADNPITNAGATLGRVLFYDMRLSLNDSVSCASCHQQAHGFSDTSRFSRGYLGGLTRRHSPGLANARYYARGHFFWDERAATLEEQVLTPIQDRTEMGMPLVVLESKLADTEFYPPLFASAFGTPDVTADRIAKALAQFVRAMVSYRSTYDRALAAGFPDGAPIFTEQERLGYELFAAVPGNTTSGAAGCHQCHHTAAQVSDSIRNNGLDASTDTDEGAGGGRFKAPSLRNVGARGPYMHDGRFATLREVVEHYNAGVQPHPQLDDALKTAGGAPKRLDLTEEQIDALVAFLRTLTDERFLTELRFTDPFKVR